MTDAGVSRCTAIAPGHADSSWSVVVDPSRGTCPKKPVCERNKTERHVAPSNPCIFTRPRLSVDVGHHGLHRSYETLLLRARHAPRKHRNLQDPTRHGRSAYRSSCRTTTAISCFSRLDGGEARRAGDLDLVQLRVRIEWTTNLTPFHPAPPPARAHAPPLAPPAPPPCCPSVSLHCACAVAI